LACLDKARCDAALRGSRLRACRRALERLDEDEEDFFFALWPLR
jgi:hypothetical protein